MFQRPSTNPVQGKDEEPKFKEPKTGFAADKDLSQHINCPRSQVWVLARQNPTFPKPLRITSGMTRWRWADVLEWEKSLKAKLKPVRQRKISCTGIG